MDQPAEQPEATGKSTAEQIAAPVLSVLHTVWLAGLGAVTVAGQQAGRAVETLIEKGKQVEPQVLEQGRRVSEEVNWAAQGVGNKLKDVASQVSRRAEAAEAMLDDRVRAALDRMGYATREDIAALSSKLDDLTARLEQMAAKRGSRKTEE